MVGRCYCFVPGCLTGQKSQRKSFKTEGKKISTLFSPPRDDNLFEKWKRIIPRTDKVLTREDRICELHFETDEIERYFDTKLNDGSVFKIKRERPVLKPGSIPTIFPNLPNYLIKLDMDKKRKQPAILNTPMKKFKQGNEDLSIVVNNESEDTEPSQNLSTDEHFNFNNILAHIPSIALPNKWWGITPTPNFVVCAKWSVTGFLEKQVLIEKNLNVKVFIKEIEIESSKKLIFSIEEISHLILEVDNSVFVLPTTCA